MTIAYVAETREHAFMLDEEGVCLHVLRRAIRLGGLGAVVEDTSDAATRCVGAQYVATLDPTASGFLAHEPAIGLPLVFAKLGPSGRISLVRTGPLEKFEARGSGLHDLPTQPRDLLADTQRNASPAIRYMPGSDQTDEDVPTLRFARAIPRGLAPASAPAATLRGVGPRGPRVA